jgi:hypothetical protein
MEYKHNSLVEAYDFDDVRLVREGESLRIEKLYYRRRPALFRGSMLRAVIWAARLVGVVSGSAILLWMAYSFVRAL